MSISQALTPPFLLAAFVLCVAGAAKLRTPAGAARAAGAIGLPSHRVLVRALALAELALGGACLGEPSRAGAAALMTLYALFTVLTLMLSHRRISCGCFGDLEAPATRLQALLSGALALLALASLFATPHGAGWLLGRPLAQAAILAAGIVAAAYGVVLAYTKLPQAWASWSGA